MKRKIFQTPHGRVIVKMRPAVNGKHKLLVNIRLHQHLTCFPIRVGTIVGRGECFGIPTRRRLEKDFKRFGQQQAEQVAAGCYADVPAPFRKAVPQG